MSINGKMTPLGVNVQSSLIKNQGFRLNPDAVTFQGTWSPSSVTDGKIVNSTILQNITLAKRNFYALTNAGTLDVSIYRNLLMLGRPIDRYTDNRINFPALGNTRPDTFKTSYAGFGTWDTKTVDEFGNISSSGSLNLLVSEYPPRNYPAQNNYSYIANSWGSTAAGPYSYQHQWNHPYAWITGWPSRNSFQETTDNYSAAYFPRPDLRTRDQNLIEYDSYFKDGFISTVARQAYNELWMDYATRRINQYFEISKSFQFHHSWKLSKNENISTVENSKTFLRGSYSNINDITTSDIAGVSLSFKLFGSELAKLGKSLNLTSVNRFGLPSLFLKNIRKNKALTDPLKFFLLYQNFSTLDINNIFETDNQISVEQEKNIYIALTNVKGQDLTEILEILNCSTEGLGTLADLIDPKKMFPESYRTLTVPNYSINTASSKTYDFIYSDLGVNSRIQNWGTYLDNILDSELAKACGAFMMTMCQIKNVTKMNIENFAQVVSNLEVTNKDLPLINSGDSVPVNLSLANDLSSSISLGSGKNGTYRFCDFFGAASGRPYVKLYESAINLLNKISTTRLENVFLKLYQKSLGNNWVLPSRGKGWTDPVINSSPTLNQTYAYDIFVTQYLHAAGTSLVTTQSITTTIFTPGTLISFVNNPGPSDTYTVVSSVINGPVTDITISGTLNQTIQKGSKIYIYETTYNGYPTGPVQDLIDAANLEIYKIQQANYEEYDILSRLWNEIGKQLFIEQRSIAMSVTNNEIVTREIDIRDIESFVKNIYNYALETQYGEAADVLEAIADVSNIGGQSIVALLREARNNQRLVNSGGELDSGISNQTDTFCASANAEILNGAVRTINVTAGGTGYDSQNPPTVMIGPQGGVFGGSGVGAIAEAVVDPITTSIIKINIINGGTGYTQIPLVSIECPVSPSRIGGSNIPGSFAGSQFTDQYPISDNLISSDSSSFNVDQAIQDVTICNCDCWNE